jgi:branched-chain amino acid transport system substrate-binding protein
MICLCLLGIGCKSREPVLIGFAGELTNRRGQGSIDARDGAQLAVDVLNAQGGIDGRPMKLLVRDDKRDPETARQVDADLIEQDVAAIIGHISSGQTAAVLDLVNDANVVLLSPISASHQFSGKRDYFFRVVPSSNVLCKALARHIYSSRHVRTLVGLYDVSNQAFTEACWTTLQTEFEALGGHAGPAFIFRHGDTDLKALITEVKQAEPEALVVIASPFDTAMLAQYARQQVLTVPFFGSSWAQSQELIEKGGQAVEDLELVVSYHPQNPYPAFTPFMEQFEARYKRRPGFGGALGYEAVLVLAHALKQTGGEAAGLTEALVEFRNLPGVQGTISLDEYGDPARDLYIVQVQDGQFKVIDTISPDK